MAFEHPLHQEVAAKKLLTLRQGNITVTDLSIQFQVAAQETGWDELALRSIFSNSVSEQIKDQLATRDEPASSNELIHLAIRINRLRVRKRESTIPQPVATCNDLPVPVQRPTCTEPPFSLPEQMQISHTHLTPDERKCCFKAGECLYCSKKGHLITTCPARFKGSIPPVKREILVGSFFASHGNCLTLPSMICVNKSNSPVIVLIDSGAEQSLSDSLVREFSISKEQPQAFSMAALTGQQVSSISKKVSQLHIAISSNHHEPGELFFTQENPKSSWVFPVKET